MENYIQIEGSKIELTQQQVEQIKSLGITKKKSPQWEEFAKIRGAYVDTSSRIRLYDNYYTGESNKNIFPTKEEAEACLALSQLCQWRDKYNEGWKPDWEDKTRKYYIHFLKNELSSATSLVTQSVLSFKTEEIRDKFLEDFRDLIEIAKPLL